ncbi:MAG: type IV pilin-like G/H family protein [Acidobacteriota bacterium]|nr:type IV pilin-like G/H family protein [Acidobacteriota bacterium]
MNLKVIQGEIRFGAFLLLLFVCVAVLLGWGCSSARTAKTKSSDQASNRPADNAGSRIEDTTESGQPGSPMAAGPTIEIKKNSPADTVKVFYERLRENRFRDALVLTNLRPAVEGLSDNEVDDLGVDFRQIAGMVPEKMPISGEIVTGNDATVTVNMPNEKSGELETQELRLRRQNGYWELLVADSEGEKRVRKEGKNYFFALRMEVHHEEAKAMLNRISKAQAVYSLKNQGRFADLRTLVEKGYVPTDALSVESTGYKYDVALAYDRSTYTALATPAAYGKSGRLSFALKIRRGIQPEMVSKDAKGESLNG